VDQVLDVVRKEVESCDYKDSNLLILWEVVLGPEWGL